MAQDIDWLSSQAGMCKVNLYSPNGQKDQERKVICFVDVSNLNANDRNAEANVRTGQYSNITDPANEPDLANLEEKEVIIIKDNEQSNHINTEGAVCLFKQGSSEEVNVVSWLSNDLKKYALGFQHALTPSGTPGRPKLFDSPICDQASQNNNNTAPSASGAERGGEPDDLAYYANKLCSLVVEMTRKEIQEKWESSGKCIRRTITSHGPGTKPVTYEGMESSMPPDERAAQQEDPFQSEMLNANAFKQGDRYSRKQDDGTTVSKGMMVYANQVASDMMLSFLRTMKVQKGKNPPPACVVLKDVLMKHSKEIVSDLIDSSMKNLHNITGALMTDSDFVYGLKKNLYNVGTQKSTEVLEAMVKRLFKVLSREDKQPRSQSVAFASYKSGSQPNQRAQGMQFASMKSETQGQGKERGGPATKSLPSGSKGSEKQTSLDVYAKELLLAALVQIQQHVLEKNKNSGPPESNASTYGYVHRDSDRAGGSHGPKRSSKPYEERSDFQHTEFPTDKSSAIMSVVQKILREAAFNVDEPANDINKS